MKKVVVLGASGYVGSRLVPFLIQEGCRVCAAGRSLSKLKERPWAQHPFVSLTAVDIFDRQALKDVCRGAQCVYYLIHSMDAASRNFEDADRRAAKNMTEAASAAGIQQVIYLGGLGEESGELSKHLRSRREVGEILRAGATPVTTLRAAMIIGRGSASFEILNYLVHRLPVMITPRWVSTQSQPIAIRNVLNYLVGCLGKPEVFGRAFDIGGADIVSYRELMDIYAEEEKLFRRWIIPIPVLTPRLSSYWIDLVTPLPASLARPLVEGLKNRVVCQENEIRRIIPQELFDCRKAIRLSLGVEQMPLNRNSDEAAFAPPERRFPGDPFWVRDVKLT